MPKSPQTVPATSVQPAAAPDAPVAPPEPRRFMLSNARCACARDFCQTEALGGTKCVDFCVRCGSDMAAKLAGEPPRR